MAVRKRRAAQPRRARDPQGRHRRRARRQGRRQARQGRPGHPPTAGAELGAERLPARPAAGGVSVVVEGLNIAKRHTKPRQSQNTERPRAPDPAGRDPRDRPAPAHQPGHAHLHQLRQADPDRPRDPGDRPARPRLPPLRRAAGGELMTSRLHERYTAEVVPALQKQFEYAQPDAGARLDQDRHQHRPRRGAHEREGDRCGPRRPVAHHRPAARS